MSRFSSTTDQLTRLGPASKLVGGESHRIVSLQNRGQNGYLTDLTFAPSATDWTNQPLVVKVLRAPTGFSLLPNGDLYIQAYVNIVESLMQTWQGFNRGLNVAVGETAIGRSNEVFQTPTRVSRNRSNVTSTIVEKDGMPIWRFLDEMTRLLIQDPDVGHPLLSGISDGFTDRLADMYSADIIAWQPDKTHRFVEQAWMMTNFFPFNEVGENTGSRVLNQDAELRTHNLTWAGTQKVGYAVDQIAQRFVDAARVTGIDPTFQPAFIGGMKADVSKVTTSALAQINELKASMASVAAAG